MIQKELDDSQGKGSKGSTKDNTLNIRRERHKQELEETRKLQQELLLQKEYTEEERKRIEFDNDKELLLQRKSQLEEELKLAKGNSVEIEKIKSEQAKVEADIVKGVTDFTIKETDRRRKAEEQDAKELSKLEYNALYDGIIQEQAARISASGEKD